MKSFIPLLILYLLVFSGCGRDAAQLTVVTGIGVDGLPGEYQVAAEVIRLTGDSQSGQSTYLNGDGLTVTGSVNRMVSKTGRTLYCNHAQVLMVSRDTAEQGLHELLEELLRGNQYPISLRLAVCKDSAAKSIQAKPIVSELHSVELEDIIREGAKQCLTPDADICSFYQEVSAPGIEGVLPFFSLQENNGEQVCALLGTALFKGEQMLSVLDKMDSQTLMWMRGKTGGTLVTENAVFDVEKVEQTMNATAEKGFLELSLTLKASDNEANKEELTKEAEAAMKTQCVSLLKRLQELQCDAVGFGNCLYRRNQSAWNQLESPWQEVFSKYPIEVRVNVEHMVWGRIWSEDGKQKLEENAYHEQ